MGKTHLCRVCGKPYEGCKYCDSRSIFMWRQVACSYECATQYFEQVMEARNKKELELPPPVPNESKVLVEEADLIVEKPSTPPRPKRNSKFKISEETE